MSDSCLICERIALARAGQNPYFITEYEYSILVVGDHQYYHGYAVLLLKDHVRDLHDLAPEVQAGMFRELMRATNAVVKTFAPDKMNHLCLGNVVPHIHWHLMPRYLSDPNFLRDPFAQSGEFKNHEIDGETAREIAAKVRANLE
jgi:diadenosine tetraphosphate (Ap4A) HIT family hydrolase